MRERQTSTKVALAAARITFFGGHVGLFAAMGFRPLSHGFRCARSRKVPVALLRFSDCLMSQGFSYGVIRFRLGLGSGFVPLMRD